MFFAPPISPMKSTKIRKLVAEGLCDSYVLMTNAGLSGSHAEEIEALLKGAGVKHVVLFGSTWISQQIHENKRLRMLVPRLYGLGDLSQILDERTYAQARASSGVTPGRPCEGCRHRLVPQGS